MPPATIKSNLQKLHVVKKKTKSNKNEKKSTKIALHYIQIAPSPAHYKRNVQIICISFFTIDILIYKTKESFAPPPPPLQTWGSSLLPIGPLACSTQASQHFIHKIRPQMDLMKNYGRANIN
jgi:hypothetical protein